MDKLRNNQSGYVGILALLVGVSVMLFLFVKVYFTPEKNGSANTTQYDSLLGDINTAKAVANQQNAKALEANKVLNDLK